MARKERDSNLLARDWQKTVQSGAFVAHASFPSNLNCGLERVFRPVIRFSVSARARSFSSSRIFLSLLAFPLIIIIAVAIYLAVTSVFENIRFGRAADQIVDIVSSARNYAAREQNFASHEGEDIISDLTNAGLVSGNTVSTPASLTNAWNGRVTVVASSPSVIRIETAVPARDCRRLAMFFAKDIHTMEVQIMEARQDGQNLWRRFYDRDVNQGIPREEDVEAACAQNEVSLAFVLGVR